MLDLPLPDRFYDVGNLPIQKSAIVTYGFWMRLRVERLVLLPVGVPGRQRAAHAAALIETVYGAYQSDFGTGLFGKALKDQVDELLKHAHPKSQEAHFKDIYWWRNLDRKKARDELRSNLERLIVAEAAADFPVAIGLELHALIDLKMRAQHDDYLSVIDDDIKHRSPHLASSFAVFNGIVNRTLSKVA